MRKVTIIGSDSYIAGKFIEYAQSKGFLLKLFSRKASGKANETVVDLFKLKTHHFTGSDVVINFAAIVHQPDFTNEEAYNSVNTNLPIYLAKEAKKAKVKQFIQMSTIAVYGEVDTITSISVEKPQNIYGKSKHKADVGLQELSDDNFIVSIVRPPMVYGGGDAPGNLMNLIKFSRKGLPLPFKNSGKERDFIHVSNLISVLSILIEKKIDGITLPTDKKSVTIGEIARLIQKHSNKKIRLFSPPLLLLSVIKKIKPNIYNKLYGLSKVECSLKQTDYTPQYNIEDGIKDMLQYIHNTELN